MGLFDNLDGRGIIRAAQTAIVKAGNGMAVLAGDDTLPVEHRQRIRGEQAYVARTTRTLALQALDEWAKGETKDATRRMAARETGTAAEETRRNTAEMRISLKWPRQSARNGHPGSGFWPPPRRPRQRPTRGVRVIP